MWSNGDGDRCGGWTRTAESRSCWWRGIGCIPRCGFKIDAADRFISSHFEGVLSPFRSFDSKLFFTLFWCRPYGTVLLGSTGYRYRGGPRELPGIESIE
jgi:hypothetical protein